MTDKLPDLTDKQFAFVKYLLQGMTASDAYRTAYPSKAKDNVIWVRASELKSHGKVKVWLEQARRQQLTAASMTKEAYLCELQRLAEQCEATGNLGAAVKATELQGKVMGHYVEKHEDVTPKAEADQLLNELRQIDPRLAELLEHNGTEQ